jgi:hypothetical protein
MALGILEQLDSSFDDSQNFLYLKSEIKLFGTNCLEIANTGECEKFIAYPCVQNLLDTDWYGNTSTKSNLKATFKFLISLLSFGFLAPFLVFDLNKIKSVSDENEKERKKSIITLKNGFSITKNYWKLYFYFLYSPRTKFAYESASYFLFLIVFSLFLLSQFDYYDFGRDIIINSKNMTYFNETTTSKKYSSESIIEFILIYWVITLVLEELRQLLLNDAKVKIGKKIYNYINDQWNYLDITGCLFFIIAIFLRIVSFFYGKDYFIAARIILCIDLFIWYMRVLHFFKNFKTLGPKLIMIENMLKDLSQFIILALIFVISFGVITHSSMYPNSKLNFNLFKSMIYKAYFPIFGEMSILDDFEKSDQCSNNNDSHESCPQKSGVVFSFYILIFYMIIANVLLINLLIAMFSSTYNKIEENADQLWKYKRYVLVTEYTNSPILPPPLSVFAYIFNIIRWCIYRIYFNNCCIKKEQSDLIILQEKIEKDEKILIINDTIEAEKKFAERYLRKQIELRNESNDSRLKHNSQKYIILKIYEKILFF